MVSADPGVLPSKPQTYDPAVKTNEPVKPGTFSGYGAKPATDTGTAKLRAFEDKHLGRKAMRNKEGHVEKGYGSPFKAMTPEQHAEHASLEKLVEAEAEVDAANVKLSAAKSAVEAAKAAVVEATKVSDKAAADAKKVADEEAKADAAPHAA
jgi:hypothetical protein